MILLFFREKYVRIEEVENIEKIEKDDEIEKDEKDEKIKKTTDNSVVLGLGLCYALIRPSGTF